VPDDKADAVSCEHLPVFYIDAVHKRTSVVVRRGRLDTLVFLETGDAN